MLFAFVPPPNWAYFFGRHGWDLQVLLQQESEPFTDASSCLLVAGMFLEPQICDINASYLVMCCPKVFSRAWWNESEKDSA